MEMIEINPETLSPSRHKLHMCYPVLSSSIVDIILAYKKIGGS